MECSSFWHLQAMFDTIIHSYHSIHYSLTSPPPPVVRKKIVTSIFLLKVNVVFSTLLKGQLTILVNCLFNRVLKTTLTFNKNIEVTIFFYVLYIYTIQYNLFSTKHLQCLYCIVYIYIYITVRRQLQSHLSVIHSSFTR